MNQNTLSKKELPLAYNCVFNFGLSFGSVVLFEF